MHTPTTLADCQALDAQDPLAALREQFFLPSGMVYLDGNSLGALPRSTAPCLAALLQNEWGQGLIGSWNQAGWLGMPQRVGDKIARLIGAQPGEVVATDSTSVNLYKVLSAAILIAAQAQPERCSGTNTQAPRVLLSERGNFPTDLYMAQSLCAQHGLDLRLVESHELQAALTSEVAVLLLTHVGYHSGAMHDMAALNTQAHAVGALTVWDLAHSAGAVALHVHGEGASANLAHPCACDFAVGCGYKFLNGGPGAPAFVWVHPQHVNRAAQPLAGWFGHAAPFAFSGDYSPAQGIARYLCGTPPLLAMAALECGVDSLLTAEPYGGMAALQAKSHALVALFIDLVEAQCAEWGVAVASPREAAQRGSQLSLRLPGENRAYAVVQALIARSVVGDFRPPDIARFGVAPLYTRYADVWQAAHSLREVLQKQEWRAPQYQLKNAVT